MKNFKSIFVILAALTMAFSFNSCKKDAVQTSQRIRQSNLYLYQVTTPNYDTIFVSGNRDSVVLPDAMATRNQFYLGGYGQVNGINTTDIQYLNTDSTGNEKFLLPSLNLDTLVVSTIDTTAKLISITTSGTYTTVFTFTSVR